MDDFLEKEEGDARNVFRRFKKRDFSGNTGQAIKNSSYQLAENLTIKFGSLFFTIIVARLLMPERMGLYSLALSTIVLFSAFSDFGISTGVVTFISKVLGRKDLEKAKKYFRTLLRWKFVLTTVCSLVLLASAYFVANGYYNKPIFYALLVGGLYIPIVGFLNFFEQSFKATNNFKMPLVKEIIFQTLRLTIVPLTILFLLKTSLSNGTVVALVLLSLTICYAISLFIFALMARKKVSFVKGKAGKLDKQEVKEVKKFLLPLTVTALSGVFFGYIDTLMLGHFVSEEFIAYYGAAFSLVGSATAIIGFTAAALFPLFAKLEGRSLERLFKKSRNITFLIAFLSAIITYFIAYYVVKIAYGSEYLTAVPILKLLAAIIFLLPISGIYDNYMISQKKTSVIAKLLIVSTIFNIGFNYFGITYGLNHGFFGPPGMFQAVLGACFATIASRLIYFVGIIYSRRRNRG